ncbi:MAG TPA: trypsin-like serine protease [Thermoanaerobaculia bacterium]|nr:trypsin-like serine protease [Thermoanaerobaculia bacterium]
MKKALTRALTKTKVYQEDKLVEGQTEEQAQVTLRHVLHEAEQLGVKVNWSSLDILYARSAKATLLGLVRADALMLVLHGQATDAYPECLSGGIAVTKKHYSSEYSCVLVSDGLVATAAHCMTGDDALSHVSPDEVTSMQGRWYEVNQKWVGKAGSGARNDIALLEILDPSFPRSIPLPRLARPSLFGKAREALLVAYGPNAVNGSGRGTRRWGSVRPIWEKEIRNYGGQLVDFDPATEFVCGAGLVIPEEPQDGLPGDSGGSLYLKDEASGGWELAGLFSRGAEQSKPLADGGGGIYVKICAYRSILEHHIPNLCPTE